MVEATDARLAVYAAYTHYQWCAKKAGAEVGFKQHISYTSCIHVLVQFPCVGKFGLTHGSAICKPEQKYVYVSILLSLLLHM